MNPEDITAKTNGSICSSIVLGHEFKYLEKLTTHLYMNNYMELVDYALDQYNDCLWYTDDPFKSKVKALQAATVKQLNDYKDYNVVIDKFNNYKG